MHAKAKKPDCDIATHKITVTFFQNEFAKSLDMQSMTLIELRDLIVRTKGKTKAKLPWLKLSRFGDKKTKQGSYRHDDNVVGFVGIELDYDGEKLSFDEAVAILKEMRVRCLIYTSPSHTEAAPRWRLLLPVSCELPVLHARGLTMRGKLCARVNGRFGGIFAPESFTLSQSYYFGEALDNPAPNHRAEIIDGRMIDLCDDLCEFEKTGWSKGAVKKTAADNANTVHDAGYFFREFGAQYGSRSDDDGPIGFDEHIARIGDGEGLRRL